MKKLWIGGKIKKIHTHTEILFLIIKIEICGVWNSAELLEIFSGLYDPRNFLFHAIFTKTKIGNLSSLLWFFFASTSPKWSQKKNSTIWKRGFWRGKRYLHCEKIKMDVWECLRFISASSICWISALLWTSWWRWYHSSSLHARTSAVRMLYHQFCVTLISMIKKNCFVNFSQFK